MDAAAIPGTWKRTLWQSLAFAAFWGCAYLFSPFAPVMALALPLLVCPIFAQGYTFFSLSLPLAPMTAFLAAGGDTAIGILLPVCPYLCLMIISLGRRWRLNLHAEMAACAGAFGIGAMGMLFRIRLQLGGALFPKLADAIVGMIQNSVSGGSILYRLVNFGILTLPDAYTGTRAFQLGNLTLLNPSLQHELLNMLRLRLSEGFASWIPSLLVQGALIIGVFTALVTARTRASRTPGAPPPPRFASLKLSRTEQGYMLALCLITLIAGFTDNAFLTLLSALTYAGFSTVYQLLGAAVLIAILSRGHPQRAPLYGVLLALIYLAMPIALFLLGIFDQFVRLRGAEPSK